MSNLIDSRIENGYERKELSRFNMLREGERPPIDKNYNNKSKNHQNNQIIDEE